MARFRPRSGRAAGDIGVDHPLEQSQRHVAAQHEGVVEGPEVETASERPPRLVAQPNDLAVADLVAAGLARPGAIAVDLALDLQIGRASCRERVYTSGGG